MKEFWCVIVTVLSTGLNVRTPHDTIIFVPHGNVRQSGPHGTVRVAIPV